MKKPRKWFLAFTLLITVAIAASVCAAEPLITSGTWRYKMTVTVETPEGIKTGSAVRQLSNTVSRIRLNMPHATNPVDLDAGEAVVVDLGARGVLFALLSGYRSVDHAKDIVRQKFPINTGDVATAIKYYSTLKDAKATLDMAEYPVLVMFKDPADPKSVTPVLELQPQPKAGPFEPYILKADRFEELFGPGVKLKDITIEMTDEPVTHMIDPYLPSFGEETGFWEWFRKLPYGDVRRITKADFR